MKLNLTLSHTFVKAQAANVVLVGLPISSFLMEISTSPAALKDAVAVRNGVVEVITILWAYH
jgi:hypothetical protein